MSAASQGLGAKPSHVLRADMMYVSRDPIFNGQEKATFRDSSDAQIKWLKMRCEDLFVADRVGTKPQDAAYPALSRTTQTRVTFNADTRYNVSPRILNIEV